ncbi:MAG: hypothetical protein HQ522_08400 [Bacteroidetes bacterium]|nr:hypothetical protein [Bacteroidota bacterium]
MKLLKKIVGLILKVILGLFALIIVVILIYAAPWLWRKVAVYPKLEKEKIAIQAQYKKPENYIKQADYNGIIHMHSYWSHDSRGKLEEILPAAKKANLEFLFFSDHPHSKIDTFPRSYSGVFGGVIFEPGTETSQGGLMICPMDTVIIDWNYSLDEVIKQVVDGGGLALYLHTEKEHDWEDSDYQAMEIYNIHTDLLDEEGSILPLITNFAINGKKHSHWAMREIYDEQTEIMANWDKLNTKRRITGIGAADAHNNQNLRARYNDDGMVEWYGPNADLLATVKPGLKEKLLLSDVPDEAGWSFRFETDDYFTSFNYVNTHVFCDTLSNVNIKDNLVAGHAFVAFENLAFADGFQYFSTDANNKTNAIMGDSILVSSVNILKAVSPFPVQFKLVKNGEVLDVVDDVYEYEFRPNNETGNYRIEAHLKFKEERTAWVLSNPIYIYK